jgi:thioredoxin-like negative regulator of GroEL
MNPLLTGDHFRSGSSPLVHCAGPVVVCLCAEWCGTCRAYQEELSRLAGRYPDHAFVWLDVDDDADLVGDLDIETFPTLMVLQGDALLFSGVLLPHIQHLDRLLATLADRPAQAENDFTPIAERLRRA